MVYGTVIVFVATLTLEAQLYANLIAESIRERRQLNTADVIHTAQRVRIVVLPAMIPAFFILFAVLGLISTTLALVLAQITALLQLAAYGYFAGRLREAGHLTSLMHGVVGALIGVMLIGFKFFAYH